MDFSLTEKSLELFGSGVAVHGVKANGIEFEVFTAGAGDRLIICLHGFPEHAVSWRSQLMFLSGLGYRVWAPNLRGYGQTSSPSDVREYRIETLVADVESLIEASGASEVFLLAHDWGGALAWLTGLRAPRRLRGLMILNLPHPCCFLREVRRPPQLFRSWYILLFQLSWLPEWLLTTSDAVGLLRLFRDSAKRPEAFLTVQLDIYRHNALRPGGMTAMLNWYRAMLRFRGENFIRRLGCEVQIPVLMLWGEEDRALSVKTLEGTEAFVPKLTLRRFPGVSHWIQHEQPDAVNTMLAAWLKGLAVPEFGGSQHFFRPIP